MRERGVTRATEVTAAKESLQAARSLDTVVVVGKESVGKSQLISSLTGTFPATASLRGTTVSCEIYRHGDRSFVDTPGILRDSDSVTTSLALSRLDMTNRVLLVISSTHLDDDLAEMLPLVQGKSGAIAATFWDLAKERGVRQSTLLELEMSVGVPIVAVDARRLTTKDRAELSTALETPGRFEVEAPETRVGWTIEPPACVFERAIVGRLLSLFLLFAPAILAVLCANGAADLLYPEVGAFLAPALERIAGWPSPWSQILGGSYGFVAMGPFLLLYALPTVISFSLLLAVYKASGLIDRVTVSLDPLVLPFGLSGRDLVRVVMGFGCNVPAVINSRACSGCSRGACVSAISFGAACSYQLPATLAVFVAAGMPWMGLVYLALLTSTTLIYLRLTVPKVARARSNRLKLAGRTFLQRPRPAAVAREAWTVIYQFLTLALPVFALICVGAALLEWLGVISWLGERLSPVMALFGLPGEAAVAIILGAIRKDGIAIGLLDADWGALKIPGLNGVQVLTVVYLAGVLLPCLVTQIAVIREMSFSFAWKMLLRQAVTAAFFALAIAWGGALLFH